MNYLAHGVRFLDRPWFAAGTAVPDWLSVVDRKLRVRAKAAQPFAVGDGSPLAELAAGVLQHLADDDWFHRTAAFAIVSDRLTGAFRRTLAVDDGFRPAFLGHIVTEIVLDRVLITRRPDLLRDYYAAFELVDPQQIEQAVGEILGRPAEGLAWFVEVFRRERFLADYADSARLLRRLNQVMQRVKLDALPDQVCSVLETAHALVDSRLPELLSGFPPLFLQPFTASAGRNADQ